MLFRDVKDGGYFYYAGNLFIKKNDLMEYTIPFGSLVRDAVYITGYPGFPCCIGDNAIVELADVVITHKRKKIFKDVPVNSVFSSSGISWFKVNDQYAVRDEVSPTAFHENCVID